MGGSVALSENLQFEGEVSGGSLGTGWTSPAAVVPAVLFLAAQSGSGFTGRIVDSTQFGDTWP